MNIKVSLPTVCVFMKLRRERRKNIFCDLFNDLSPAAQNCLVALMWSGEKPRAQEYFNLLEQKSAECLTERTAEEIYGKKLLVKYWERGLKKQGILPEKYDKLLA